MSFKGVEIDIRMRQNVAEEAKKSEKGIESLSNSSKKMQQELKENVAVQKQVLKQLRSELLELEKDFKKVNFGSSDPKLNSKKIQLGNSVRFLRNEIKLEEEALKSLEKQQQSYTNKSNNLETEIRNVRNEMAALKMQGRENTQEYKMLEERLGLLGTAYKELSATQKALSTGGTQMAGILSGLNAVSGAFTATVGAMGMVNSSSETMEKMQTRIQSMMAITIGLQQVSNTLHKTSAFRITTVNKVKELWAIANTKVATTLGITNVQAQILMGTLTLGLSVAITAIVIAIDRYITTQKEAAERTKKFNESVADSASDIMASYSKMQKEWEALGDSLKDKQKYIVDNQKAFDKMGVSINGVNDADSLFIKNTEAFKTAILERAKAAAYLEQMKEEYKKIIPLELEADKKGEELDILGQAALQKQVNKRLHEIEKIREKAFLSLTKEKEKLKEAGLSPNEVGNATKLFWENQKKAAQTALESMKDTQKGTEVWNEQMRLYNQATVKLEAWNFTGTTKGTEKNKQKQAAERLKKLGSDVENEINATVLATMEKGKQKRLAKIEEEHLQRVQKIKKYKKETIELEKFIGEKAPKRHVQIDKWEQEENKRYKVERKAVEDAYKKDAEKQWQEILSKYATYEQQKTAIRKKYAAERKQFEDKNEKGKYDKNIKEVNKAEARAYLELEKSAKGTQSMIADIFSNLSEKPISEMKKIIANAKLLFKYLQKGKWSPDNEFGLTQGEFELYRTPENMKALGDGIKKADNIIKKTDKSLKTLLKDVEKLFKGDFNEGEFEELFGKISSKIQSTINMVGMFSDSIYALGEITNNSGLKGVADYLGGMTSAVSDAMNGAQAGMAFGPVGAGIGAALGLISGGLSRAAEMEKKHRQELQKIKLAGIQEQQIYNQLLFEQQILMKDADSIFGVNALAKAITYISLYQESYERLQDKLKKKNKRLVLNLFGQEIKTNINTYLSELDKIQVKTGSHTTGILWWKKQHSEYKSITKVHDDLIDKQGKLNILKAEALLKSRELKEEDKLRLQEIIQLYKQAEEAENKLDDYLRDTYGELGKGLMDSVINALRTGEDAFEAFAKSAASVMGNLGKQLVKSLYILPLFEKLKAGAKDILKEGAEKEWSQEKIISEMVKLVKRTTEETKKQIPLIQGTLKAVEENAGVEIWKNTAQETSRQAVGKGIAQASQDSIDDVLGRLYTLVRFVNEIRLNEQLTRIAAEQNISMKSLMLEELKKIVENTSFNKYLKEIAADIEDLKQHGIKLKTA